MVRLGSTEVSVAADRKAGVQEYGSPGPLDEKSHSKEVGRVFLEDEKAVDELGVLFDHSGQS